jgi:hypothetical protein
MEGELNRCAPTISSPPKTGEEWVAAFGRREVAAVFPFSVLESLLNGLEVPFSSGAATLEFHHDHRVRRGSQK